MRRTLTIVILLLIFLQARAQTVDFSFSTANGRYCNPQAVTFTQNVSPSPVNYVWNFGNGMGGSNASETITYNSAGTFTVQLTAVYPDRAISATKTITIEPTPFVSLSADRVNLCQPGTVNFTAAGSVPASSYEWNFGDGSPVVTTGGNTTSHSFSSYNTYAVSVKASTAGGCTDTGNNSITVVKFPVSGNVTPASGCIPSNSTLSVATQIPPGDAAQNFLWDFGDGSPTANTGTGMVNHLYNITTNITTAAVTITSSQGCTNLFTFPAFAFGTPPFATDAHTVSSRTTFCGSETIQFYGKATNANQYKWNFGDGNNMTVTDTIVSYRYRSLGNKVVILTPYFNGCEGTKDTIDIFIEGVIADFNMANSCSAKNSYSFSNISLGNVDHFEWAYSDAPALIDSVNYNSAHTFPASGVFNASLLLIDSITGCRDSLSRPILTAQSSLIRSVNRVCKDSLIVYSIENAYPPGYGYNYEFHIAGYVYDNGSITQRGIHPLNRGDFNDFAVIRDTVPGTCDDTLYFSSPTRVSGPVAEFDVPARVCADTAVRVINNSTPFFAGDDIIKWKWNYDDNRFDTVKDPPTHSYLTIGMYGITLTATDINGCGNAIQKYVHIAQLPSLTAFPAVDTLCQGSSAMLIAFSADSIVWSPATNINCVSCDTVQVNPASTTAYVATAINPYGCKATDTSIVKVYAPLNLVVYPADTSVCAGDIIRYNTNGAGITSWSPPTFLSNSNIPNPVARPTTPITYTVVARDSVGCFTDTAYAVVNINPVPTVDAGADIIVPYYDPFNINPVYSNDVVQYRWYPAAELSCTTCPAPTGVAKRSQLYTIEVQNNFGCKHSDSIQVFINCLNANLLMPNAFTPNQDGRNEYFYPITRGYKTVRHFVVFNRYGNKVFERRNFDPNIPTLGWDGRIKDYKYGTSEVFSWFMEAECDLGEIMNTKGTVILVR